MVNIRVLLYLFDKERFFKILLGISLFMFIPLFDFYIIFKIAYMLGNYLSLAVLSAFSGFGLLILITQLNKNLDSIKNTHLSGYEEKPFLYFLGSIPAVVFILIPGFLSTFLGLLFLIPPIKATIGNLLSRLFKIDWTEIYEYFYILYK